MTDAMSPVRVGLREGSRTWATPPRALQFGGDADGNEEGDLDLLREAKRAELYAQALSDMPLISIAILLSPPCLPPASCHSTAHIMLVVLLPRQVQGPETSAWA